MSVSPLRLGIAGLGTVGGGVVRLVSEQSNLLQARCGRPIRVAAVSALDQNKDRGLDLSAFDWHDDPVVMAGSDAIDVFVELIGGEDGPAKVAVEAAIAAGKNVVTANKALIAHHGTALAIEAERRGVTLNFEAAVAGGIPIVKATGGVHATTHPYPVVDSGGPHHDHFRGVGGHLPESGGHYSMVSKHGNPPLNYLSEELHLRPRSDREHLVDEQRPPYAPLGYL